MRSTLWCATGLTPVAASLVFALSNPAQAQEERAGFAPGELEEIVVTARRREEKLQSVPVAVSAFTAETLSSLGVEQTTDLQRFVPGVVFNGSGSPENMTFYIRGQGRDVIGPGLPSVISYFNEIPLPSVGSVLPTYDVANIQVLKGPQGTLFGRNTTGGAVLVYSQEPTYETEGYGEATVGDYSARGVEGAVNLPLIDNKLAVRIAAQHTEHDGYVENLGTGGDLDDADNWGARVSVLFEPTSNFSNLLVFDKFESDTAGAGEVPIGTTPFAAGQPFYKFLPNSVLIPAGGASAFAGSVINNHFNCGTAVNCDIDLQLARQQQLGIRKVYSDIVPLSDVNVWGVSNTSTLTLSTVTLKNIFGYRRSEVNQFSAVDGLGLAALNAEFHRQEEQYTDELQLSGSMFGDKLDYLFGAFYLKSDPVGQNGLDTQLFSVAFADLTPAEQALLPAGFPGLAGASSTFYGDESKAVFANFDYALTDKLSVSAGYRYTWDEQSLCASTARRTTGDFSGTVLLADEDVCKATAGAYVDEAKSSAPTWSAGLNYQANEDLFLYGVVRRGYRSGNLNAPRFNPNAPNSTAAFQTYGPQFVTDGELGVKSDWDIGGVRTRVNLAVFEARYEDLQNQVAGIPANFDGDNDPTNDPASTALVVNAGEARVRGVEIDGNIRPIDGLVFTYGAAFLDAEYTSFNIPAPLNVLPTSTPKFNSTPQQTYSAGLVYTLPVDIGGASIDLGADYYHISDRIVSLAQFGGYGLTNARVEVTNIAGADLTAAIFVNNVTDEEYLVNSGLTGTQPGVLAGTYGPPRTVGLRVRYGF